MHHNLFPSRLRWWLPLFVAAAWLPVLACAQSCGSIPSTYPISAGSGTLTVGSGSQVSGTTISGSGVSVQMNAARTSSTPTFPVLAPSTYPTFSSNANTSASTVAAGTYSNVTPGGGTTTFTGSTYYIGSLSASPGARYRRRRAPWEPPAPLRRC